MSGGIAVHEDILRIAVGGVIHNVVLQNILTDTSAVIRNLDGSLPNFTAATAGVIVDWFQTVGYIADGVVPFVEDTFSSNPQGPRGFFYSSGHGFDAFDLNNDAAKFAAAKGGGVALKWGTYDGATSSYIWNGILRGNGNITVKDISAEDASFTGSIDALYGDISTVNVICNGVAKAVHSVGVATVKTGVPSIVVDCDTDGDYILWAIDASNPSGVGTNVLDVTINNFIFSGTYGGKVVVALRRRQGNYCNEVSFAVTGYTSLIELGDTQLQPISHATNDYWDIYEGVGLYDGTTRFMLWSVKRHVSPGGNLCDKYYFHVVLVVRIGKEIS
jgi:hypothetical protein